MNSSTVTAHGLSAAIARSFNSGLRQRRRVNPAEVGFSRRHGFSREIHLPAQRA